MDNPFMRRLTTMAKLVLLAIGFVLTLFLGAWGGPKVMAKAPEPSLAYLFGPSGVKTQDGKDLRRVDLIDFVLKKVLDEQK